MRVEFPVTDTVSVTMTRPTEGQMLALSLSRKSGNREDNFKLVQRIGRILEALMGPEQWDSVFEEGLISGEIPPQAFVQLANDVLQFDWSGAAEPLLGPEPDQTSYDGTVRVPEDRAEIIDKPKPTRPAPRVVSGG